MVITAYMQFTEQPKRLFNWNFIHTTSSVHRLSIRFTFGSVKRWNDSEKGTYNFIFDRSGEHEQSVGCGLPTRSVGKNWPVLYSFGVWDLVFSQL